MMRRIVGGGGGRGLLISWLAPVVRRAAGDGAASFSFQLLAPHLVTILVQRQPIFGVANE